jgi:glycosyltransferase involved in cell wall biosynthesis
MKKRLLFVVSEDSYFVSHRLHLAKHAMREGYDVGFLGNISNHKDLLQASGVTVYDWNIDRGALSIFSQIKTFVALYRSVKDYRPQVVHAVAAKPILYSSLACFLLGIKSQVYALGGLGFMESSKKALAAFVRRVTFILLKIALHGKSTLLILQNSDDAELLVSKKVVDAGKIRIVRGAGVNTELFNITDGAAHRAQVVLPARMLWDKGVGEFVEAAREIKKLGIDAAFVLVGEPDQKNPECVPSEWISKCVAEGVIEWWGYRDDMLEVFASTSIVCLPSHREGLPKVLLEAASCSLPIVAFDVPGCREVVVDGQNGFLVKFGDIDGLVKALTTLLLDEILRAQMGKYGRELVKANFAQERVAAETAAVWEEVT